MAVIIMPDFPPRRVRKFWNNIEKASIELCWNWIGATDRKGYGKFFAVSNGNHKLIQSHRISYFLHYGVDPGDSLVLHQCDNPSCCNPNHLRLGTHKENMKDMASRGHVFRSPTLADNDIFMMRELWASNMFTQGEICRFYDLSRAAVCNAINGRTGKHVPFPDGYDPRHRK